jgi:hypothetical protein
MTVKKPNTAKKTTKTTKKTTKPKAAAKPAPKEVTKMTIMSQEAIEKEFGEFLTEQDNWIAVAMSQGKTDDEIKKTFKVDETKLAKLRSNPNFLKDFRNKIQSTGLANKDERISKVKRMATAVFDDIFRRIEDGELEKQSINTVWQMGQQLLDRLEKLLGETDKKEANINIHIKELIQTRTKTSIEDLNKFNPDDEYPIIDVEVS